MMKRFYEFGQRRVARLKDRQRVARRAGLRVERLEARQLLAGDLLVGDFHPDQFLVRFTDAAAAESHL